LKNTSRPLFARFDAGDTDLATVFSLVGVEILQRKDAGLLSFFGSLPPSFTLVVRYRQTGFKVFVDGFKIEIPQPFVFFAIHARSYYRSELKFK
jgi:hypothetical protein